MDFLNGNSNESDLKWKHDSRMNCLTYHPQQSARQRHVVKLFVNCIVQKNSYPFYIVAKIIIELHTKEAASELGLAPRK